MSKQITANQTEQLFQFCRNHYVYHYDVQIELVDHLASAIEEQWEENPQLDFNEALKKSFSKFGIYGFSKVKEEKEKALRKKYNRLHWQYLLNFFSWPKILLTSCFTIVLFTLFQITEEEMFIVGLLLVASLVVIVYYYSHYFPKNFKIKTREGSSFLLLKQLRDTQYLAFFILQTPFHIYNLTEFKIPQNSWLILFISFFIVILFITTYSQFFYVPKKIKEHFMEQFGEFAL